MAFLFDWATLGTANGTTSVTDGALTMNLTASSDPAVFYNAFQGGNLFASGVSTATTSTVTFSMPVANATFEILDVDSNEVTFDDQVTILAFDADGNAVAPIFSNLEAYHVQTGNTVEANGNSSTAVDGPGAPDSITVSFGSAVTSISVIFDDGSSVAPAGAMGFGDISGDIICFAKGTLIRTRNGDVPVEKLMVGDEVATADHGYQPIRWIGSRRLDQGDLARNPKLRPVRFSVGSLSASLPTRDLLVSRQHRMLVKSKVAARMFGMTQVLVSAFKLTGLPGIQVDDDVQEVEYFHLMFSEHEVIFAEGAPSESLLAGAQALNTVSPEAREELFALFPQLRDADHRPTPAAEIPPGKQQKNLVRRLHKNNKKPLELLKRS